MHLLVDTPAKRRKLAKGNDSRSQTYDSQNDSGDDLFADYETVATVPVAPKPIPTLQDTAQMFSSSPPHVTQPTQLVHKASPGQKSGGQKQSIVQVAVSSPTRTPTSSPVTSRHPLGGRLASSMAPAGTVFKPPKGVIKDPAALIVNISDDEPFVRALSSDDDSDSGSRADIKPSTFTHSGQKHGSKVNKPSGSFTEIMSNSFYRPTNNGEKTDFRVSTLSESVYDQRSRNQNRTTIHIDTPSEASGDIMANAYGTTRRLPKQVKQTGPAKALPATELEFDDIEDYQLRSKIRRMRQILPLHTVRACKDALECKKYNFDDAIELLASQEARTKRVDLTSSDGEYPLSSQVALKKAPAKQQIKAPNLKIQDKWTATQAHSTQAPSSLLTASPVTLAPKRKRRLVQGRKRQSSPIATPKQPSPRIVISSPNDSDSGVGTGLDSGLDHKALNLFNTCSIPDLVDLAGVTQEIASVLLSQKPFASLDDVRQVSSDVPEKTKIKRKMACKPFGDKIVDKCLNMLAGYEAIDKLVKRCEELAQPVKEDMKGWGVNVFGAATEGELELVSFERYFSPQDSAIGTPNSIVVSDEEDVLKKARSHTFFPQPTIMATGIQLKDYQVCLRRIRALQFVKWKADSLFHQVVGVNWLSLLFKRKLSCILADDMGLGKTCQVVAFLAHLLEKGTKGPHLVVVPGSTLENWLREFSVFCPNLHVMPYYAGQNERPGIQTQILDNLDTINIVVTTYTLAKTKDDNKFLRKLKPVVCVFDEGHLLKNSKSAGYEALMRIPTQFRLLLTGTPLQNNLRELASLLGFILPSVFKDHSDDLEAIFSHKVKTTDESHAALLSNQRIARAKSIMAPFVLRRKKHQVLKYLPIKTRRVEHCELSKSQSAIYTMEKARAFRIVTARTAGGKVSNETSNIMMALRKASIHPLLFRRLYDDQTITKMSKACLGEQEFAQSNADLVYEDMEVMTDMELHRFCEHHPETMTRFLLRGNPWMDSGKVSKLATLLSTFKQNGDRVLVFSQFVMVLDILEAVMETLAMQFFRLDGSTPMEQRQDMIDQFHEEEGITVFLLSTGAGGTGINLACKLNLIDHTFQMNADFREGANKVIIFDSSFNPQSDQQAENRAHRVGQAKEVEVFRLVTKDTIEEQIHALGETKLALDDRVAGVITEVGDDKKAGVAAERQGAKIVEDMMLERLKTELHVEGKDAR